MIQPSNPTHSYWNFDELSVWVHQMVTDHEWIQLETIGTTREGRSIFLLTLGENPETTPAMWVDALTHASEWAGMMGLIHTVEQWVEWQQSPEGQQWFQKNTVYCVPCVSPDGLAALMNGEPFLRSSTRPPKEGTHRVGFEAKDMDGNGRILWMRWKDPAGPYVADESSGFGLRKRRIGDDPEEAYFVANEGEFVEWDGHRWTHAPLKHGLDLNRNFPIRWAPFEMFGMDGGTFSLSEPESRALMDAVTARRNIVTAMTLHTYTGAILTQPYNANTDLSSKDLYFLQSWAEQLVQGTGYRVFRVHPDFAYDPKQSIVGVWADCLSSTLGIPAYTLEIWDPFKWAGLQVKDPARFFVEPKEHIVQALLNKASNDGEWILWNTLEHPQLGKVEIGGIDYLRTIRNPPISLLHEECNKTFSILETMRQSLPIIEVTTHIEQQGVETFRLTVCVENQGYLSSAGLQRAVELNLTGQTIVSVTSSSTATVVGDARPQIKPILDGWGCIQTDSAKNLLYPSLPLNGHRQVFEWWIQGAGEVVIHWSCSRAGSGSRTIWMGDEQVQQLTLF